jgi:acetyltransferase-like isoleucine patch superfamily enzyme
VTAWARLESARTALWLRKCARVGEQPQLKGKPYLYVDQGSMILGDRCVIASRPVQSHLAVGPGAVLEIGDEVSIGHGAAIAAFERVQIGSQTRIGPFLVLMDTNFHDRSGEQSVQHECRPVIIGRNCLIGSRVTITRGASIGDGAEILAGSTVSSEIPAGACAGGVRAQVLGRAGDPALRLDPNTSMVMTALREVFELETLPQLETDLAGLPLWGSMRTLRLRDVLASEAGPSLDLAAVENAVHVADLVAAVVRANRTIHVAGEM